MVEMQRGNESPFFIFTFFGASVDIVYALLYIMCIESETVTKTGRMKMSVCTVEVKLIEECDGKKRVVLNGVDACTGYEFENQEFYVNESTILYDDGTPCECESDFVYIAVRNSTNNLF